MIIYISTGIGVLIILLAVWAKYQAGWQLAHRRFIGALVVAYGIFLASLTGNYSVPVLPGIGSVVSGSSVGAAAGFGTWAILGTIGVATGGVGIASGALGMAAIGAIFGGSGSAAGNFGIHQLSYPLIIPIFWVPI